jgi:hypothetical protein
VVRLGAVVIAMEVTALAVAFGYFGWPVLLIGAPVLLGTALVLLLVRASEAPRRKLQEHRAARWDAGAQLPGGLMSGFFQIPKQGGPVEVPEPIRAAGGH